MPPQPDRRALLALGAWTLGGWVLLAPRAMGADMLVNLAEPAPPPPPTEAAGDQVNAARDAARRMSVEVRLNGQGPFTFVVDTGANVSVIAAETAAAIGLPPAGQAQVHGIAGAEATSTVKVDRLSVGQVTSRRLRLPVLPIAALGVQGLLGVDVLKDRRVVMDFQDSRLEIGPSGYDFTPSITGRIGDADHDPDTVAVAARYRSGQLLIVDASVANIPVTAFLDSGSQNTVANLALRQRLLERQPELAATLANVELLSATGQTASGELCLLPGLRLGGVKMTGLSAVFADLHTFDIWGLKTKPAVLIGIDVLRHFNAVELDFGRRRVVFRAPTGWRRPR
ncbi:MAG: aspartyl protease family protein [Caulobacteraceae bacterium]|nr:aspartyl protease family protein [Caulobacteraceae bacterium]